jgi:hypothetical protein
MPRARRTLRFDITDKGFERGKQRFVSHDPHEIARACGALNVHATINWEKLEGQESAERITGWTNRYKKPKMTLILRATTWGSHCAAPGTWKALSSYKTWYMMQTSSGKGLHASA